MVDLSLLQSVSYIAGALGVCVAAFYYVMNLREANKNRRITFTNSVMQQLFSEEGVRREFDCYTMQWTDFEDFKRKYDSRVNPESYSKRMSLWLTYDSLGYLYKSGLIDLDTVANVGGGWLLWDWLKFKPVIEELRKTAFGPKGFSSFEYLAETVLRLKERDEPDARARYGRVEKEYRVAQ
jgi:hypothetical protein